MDAGKGSSPRQVDKARYDKNFDEIKWKKKKCKHGYAKGINCKNCNNLEYK